MTVPDLAALGRAFGLRGRFVYGGRFGNGHIHDTFTATWESEGVRTRYVHQRLNATVFPDLDGLMRNYALVVDHLGGPLVLMRTADGAPLYEDGAGAKWRTVNRIGNAITRETIGSEDEAREAARAFGQFARRLSSLDPRDLREPIPRFHDTPARLAALRAAARRDPLARAAAARTEIAFAEGRTGDAARILDRLRSGELPARVVHNDTKVNNLLFDPDTGEACAVIDLDTVMPGSVLFDFGDLVRTCVSPSAEDERDLDRVRVRNSVFAALAEGYLAGAGDLVTPAERELMPFAGRLMALETGIRFLTDHLEGDRYFKVHRPGHNLDRTRTQFRLVERLDEEEPALARLI